jgi:hypothetical protein
VAGSNITITGAWPDQTVSGASGGAALGITSASIVQSAFGNWGSFSSTLTLTLGAAPTAGNTLVIIQAAENIGGFEITPFFGLDLPNLNGPACVATRVVQAGDTATITLNSGGTLGIAGVYEIAHLNMLQVFGGIVSTSASQTGVYAPSARAILPSIAISAIQQMTSGTAPSSTSAGWTTDATNTGGGSAYSLILRRTIAAGVVSQPFAVWTSAVSPQAATTILIS